MALPVITVEVAFDSDPLDVTPVWTDISSKADGINITIGKQSQLDVYQPGTASLTLDNRDRRFDPTHTGSPYYSGSTKVLPRKKLRIRATWLGTTYDLYTGFVDGWPQRPAGLKVSDIQIGCTDLFGILANIELPSSVYALEVAGDEPKAWWRLNEDRGTDLQDSSGNKYDGTYNDGATFLSTRHPNPWETVTAIAFDENHHAVVEDSAARVAALPIAVEFIMRVTGDMTSAYYQVVRQGSGGTSDGFVIFHDDVVFSGASHGRITAVFKFVDLNGRSVDPTVAGYINVKDGEAHHVVCKRTATVFKIYVDGVDQTVLVDAVAADAFSMIHVGGLPGSASSPAFLGDLADVAIYDTDLSAVRITAHAAAFLAPWEDDTTGERIEKLALLAGLDPTQYDIDTGHSYLGPAVLGGTVLEKQREIEATEQGSCYVDHANAGILRFDDRHVRLTAARSTSVQATFTDENTPGAIHVEAGSIELLWDWELIYNEVTVAWSGGADVTVFDQDSIDTYGRRTYTVQTQSRTAAEARNLGEWILNHYKEPIVRVRSLVLDSAADDSSAAAALALQIGDLVELKVKPQDTGSRITFELLVEGKSVQLDKASRSWTTTLYLSPADTQEYAIWGTGLWGTAVWGY